MKKRIISIILAALFILPLFAFVSFADDTGQIGKNVFWRFDSSTGCLTVYGSGEMYNYYSFKRNGYPSNIKSVVIEEGVESVGSEVFSEQTDLQSVTIPNSVKSIGADAFYHCGLISIDIPESVSTIGYRAFRNCAKLKTVTLRNGLKYIWDQAFAGCASLTSVTLPDTVTQIGDSVFLSCMSLTSVFLSGNLSRIENYAFYQCRSLSVVYIPDGVKNIGGYAFAECSSLSSINLPESIISIGDRAFSDCRLLERIKITDYVRNISQYAFDGTAYYNNGNNWEGASVYKGALYIGKHLIRIGEVNGRTYTVRNGTKTISGNTFDNAYVSNIYVPKSVVYIGICSGPDGGNIYYGGTENDRGTDGLKNSFYNSKWHYNAYSAGEILASDFADIPKNAWYVDDVLEAYQRGLLVGTGYKTFSPEMPMTRAMFMATIYRMEGEPPVTKDDYFVDVYEGKWYSDAINWAAEVGIVVGVGNGRFNPEESIKREEVAAILYDYTWLHDGNIYDRVDLYKYGDGYKTDFWAFEDMSWAVANGLIVGTGKGLEPRSTATRAQIASILVRYISKFS